MNELSSVDWSRAQFALTALYHFLFVPLTLGLSFMIAIMETIYVKTKNERWKKITKFWLSLFAINFAIGVATGIIMEFEFGTNWANYSWFVGDIFGAPLAVEGIMAFFLEATFFAVMFFGWDKVSKGFHLLSTWCVAIGSNLSAFWILVANGWMQYPVGMSFNPDTARNEMQSFFEVALSPVAISKFLHTIGSGYVISALFVMGISAWFMLKGRHIIEAKKSLVVGASFGLVCSIFLFFSGDESAYRVTQTQPMKLAAMEGVYQGEHRAGLVPFGILNPKKTIDNNESVFLFDITIPYALSILGNRDPNSFVPGIEDLIYGNESKGIEPMQNRIDRGKIAIQALKDYKLAKENNDTIAMANHKSILETHFKDFGYGYLEKPSDTIPPVALTFYSFHIMVALGSFFFLLFIVTLYLTMANDIEKFRKVLWVCLLSIPLGYIAAEAGWIVAEVGRQPWAIQDLLPVHIAATQLGKVNVQISFWIFAVLFTALLIAEVKIMLTQIKKGFDAHAGHTPLMGKGEKIMFFGLELEGLQIYWWLILSLLGGLLVFMFFVQGGQTLIDELSKDELEKTMLVNSLGRKWELGFTTLVLFGGAAFAAFPLFYSTSFGGAYWAWLCILFCFILQAVAYEYRKKENNVYGSKTYEIFLKINGYLGVFLIGVAVSSFFSGSEFILNEHNFVSWQNPLHGLELLLNPFNYLLGLALVFLARLLGAAYFMNNINDENIKIRAMKKLMINSILFLPFFLGFLAWIFLKDGFSVDTNGVVSMSANLYLYNFLNQMIFAVLLVIGVILVLLGMVQGTKGCSKAIFTLGLGTVLTVFALLSSIGLGQSAFYPSLSDLQSSLTLKNASSSYYTLSVMAYVSLLVPFVLAYIIYVWNAMDKVKITREEIANDDHAY